MIGSVIVQKFYTSREKIGIKKHKVLQPEIDFLETLSDVEQCDAFCDESDYNIEVLNTKIKISLLIFFLLTTTTILLFISQFYWLFLVTFLCTGVSLFFTKKFKNRIDVYRIEKMLFSDAKEQFLAKIFK